MFIQGAGIAADNASNLLAGAGQIATFQRLGNRLGMLGQAARYVAVGANSYEVWLIDTSGTPHRLARPDLASQLLAGTIGEPMQAFADDNQHQAAADALTAALPDDDMTAHTLAPTPTPLAEPITPIGGQGRAATLSAVSVVKNTPAPTTAPAQQQASTSTSNRVALSLLVAAIAPVAASCG